MQRQQGFCRKLNLPFVRNQVLNWRLKFRKVGPKVNWAGPLLPSLAMTAKRMRRIPGLPQPRYNLHSARLKMQIVPKILKQYIKWPASSWENTPTHCKIYSEYIYRNSKRNYLKMQIVLTNSLDKEHCIWRTHSYISVFHKHRATRTSSEQKSIFLLKSFFFR